MMHLDPVLNANNLEFVEQQYDRYLEDPDAVDPSWRAYFDDQVPPGERQHYRGAELKPRSIFNPDPPTRPCPGWEAPEGATTCAPVCGQALRATVRLSRVFQLVNNYRVRGHLLADLDPLKQRERKPPPELELSYYGFTGADLEAVVPNGGFHGPPVLKLKELVQALRATYCRHIGVEFMNIQDPVQKNWLLERMERSRNRHKLSRDEQVAILGKLVAAESLEQFLHTKYVGTKRFSLQGAESLIPLLDVLFDLAGAQGIDEVVMGMPHRGRLNVVVNLLGQAPSRLFAQFEDIDPFATLGSGDVKYHLGFCTNSHVTRHGHRMHISLTANPSHLEAVNPVVEGRCRAKQDRREDFAREHIMPLLIHGDAAFAGQGLVAETLNLAGLEGYRTGGTIHVIVNNQIGFTTPPSASRSTPYSTDVARMMQIPIFHVNGEDLESVVQVAELAMAFRQTFKKDVVIDLFCWRKYGHNEMDEPSFTQPLMYKLIDTHPSVARTWSRQMVKGGWISQADADDIVLEERKRLEGEFLKIHDRPASTPDYRPVLTGLWEGYRGGPWSAVLEVETRVHREVLDQIAARLRHLPDGFTPHRKIRRLIARRDRMARGELPIDWGMGEMFAFGTLLWEGRDVRLSGQDSRRGTFSHRHTVFTDIDNGREYSPLANLKDGQGRFFAHDSALSEAGVLGFEFGYSMNAPSALVIWEAQFGDFANGAQVIIDQFIASSEDKWGRLSGLVMFLPHGYEGQGPEHSSARLERFLQLCARDNMQVCVPTTPAQHFHLLRRQVLRPWRKPLVVLTPKSLLRHPQAVSSLDAFTGGRFRQVWADASNADPAQVRRVLLCSGKFFYELEAEREKRGETALPIIRLEQLYPFPWAELQETLARYPHLEQISWCQEEPRNMGAWEFVRGRFTDLGDNAIPLDVFSRSEAASPATGSHRAHVIEQRMLLDDIFDNHD